MSTYDISVLIPAIRTHLWESVYDTFCASCTRYSFEMIFAGPFDPPTELASRPNIKYLKCYSCPSVAAQKGAQLATGTLLLHSVDDARFIPTAVDVDLVITEKVTILTATYF